MQVLHLRGFDPGKLRSSVEKVCAAIARGDLRSADVHKLRGAPYHRAKLNDSDRLLLQFVRHEQETICLVLELVVRHAYEKSRFLRGAKVPDDALESAFEPDALVDQATPPLRFVPSGRTEFRMLDKPLCFDDAQEAALTARPPLVVVGSAGSGKTALLLQAMREQRGTVAYVTESRWLAESARALYVANGGAPDEQDVSFLSLLQLVQSIAVPPGPLVSWRQFRAFFETQAAGNRVLREAGAVAVFEELRGVLTAEPEGPLTLDAYLALGVKQSLFPSEQRAAVHELCSRYRDWLTSEGLCDPNLLAHALLARAEPVWDFVCIDEVQDLTNVQLALVLATLRPHAGFILAGDANQIVHPNYFSWAGVKSLFWRGRGALDEDRAVHLLRMSYRNSERVTAVANRLLALKVHRYGSIDRESNRLMQSLPGEPGETLVLPAGGPGAKALAERCRDSTEVAVVVLREEHKAQAQQFYGTPLVFSIHEAKGLEYRTVVLHRLISSAKNRYAALAEGIDPAALDATELQYRRAKDKTDKSLEADKFYVNALYVALTRAVHDVVAVEDDPNHPLLTLLGIRGAESANEVAVKKASREDWQREASRLEAQGKAEQAEAIRRDVLHQRPVPWQVYDRSAVAALVADSGNTHALGAKARDQLREFAYLHDDANLLLLVDPSRGRREAAIDAETLYFTRHRFGASPRTDVASRLHVVQHLARFLPAMRPVFDARRPALVQSALSRCAGKSLAAHLSDTETYGTEHRTVFGLTQLMVAAYRGDLTWIDALLERGATLDPLDPYGKSALSWALLGARDRADLGSLGELWERLAPAAIDVEVDGHALQLGREMPEFLVLQLAIAEHTRWLRTNLGRLHPSRSDLVDTPEHPDQVFWPTFTSAGLSTDWWEAGLPGNVLAARRQRRPYLNSVLARAECESTYRPARRLWVRARHGRYALSPMLRVRQRDERWLGLDELLGTDLLAATHRHFLGVTFEQSYELAAQAFRERYGLPEPLVGTPIKPIAPRFARRKGKRR